VCGRPGGDVGDLVRLVVELVQARVDGAEDIDVLPGRHVARVKVRKLADHREADRLVRSEVLRLSPSASSTRCSHRDCSQRHGEGTEQCDSRHATSYKTRLEEGALICLRPSPKSIAIFPPT